MKIGDLVRWVSHKGWPCGGLGLVFEIDSQNAEFFTVWFTHFEEFGGWKEAIEQGAWYDDEDLANDIEVISEAR